MNAQPRPLSVGWKVHSLAGNMASVRYRALLPVAALEPAGIRSRVFGDGSEAHLEGLDALVIVKSFTPDDLRLAQTARRRGMPVVFDLCDNIFVEGYAGRTSGLTIADVFLTIAEHASCIVTPTEPLARTVRARVPEVPVRIVPDGIETPEVAAAMARILREAKATEQAQASRMLRQRLRSALGRVKNEGVHVLPSLLRSLVRRMRKRVRPDLAPPTAAAASEPTPALTGAQRLVWFGNHGAGHGRFGMLDILEYREALETLARERDIELVVISNNREKFDTHIRPLAIPCRYVEWGPEVVGKWLQHAAAVLVPNTRDDFSICKSANRTVLALASGVPVVATMTPALQPLAPFIHTGDPLEALRRVLAEPRRARSEAEEGYRQAAVLFGTPAIRAAWHDLLLDLVQAPDVRPAPGRPQPFLAVVLHLVQDLDLALPILKEAQRTGVACEAWCSPQVFGKSPRVLASLKREGVAFQILPERDDALRTFTFPAATRALLTVAETSLGPHRVPRLLTEVALRQKVFVATLQHGFENVGLTYEDAVHPIDKVDIAAQRIYIWGPRETLHPRLDASVRERCVPVGCPKQAHVPAADLSGLVPAGGPIVGIFENLHWHRYPDTYRRLFLDAVEALAAGYPQTSFLVKPHHAGVWLSRRHEGERPAAPNIFIADPQAPEWEQHTAAALLPNVSAVVTTPSTVALDAARIGLPVAVFAGELPLDSYAPLPLLAGAADAIAFVGHALDARHGESLRAQASRFVERTLVPGDAARRIVDDLRQAGGLGAGQGSAPRCVAKSLPQGEAA